MVTYEINGHYYDKGYYLSDGIYPFWTIFVKTIHTPKKDKESMFSKEGPLGRISRGHLMCSNLIGLLFVKMSGH
jgi:hypothetical protein